MTLGNMRQQGVHHLIAFCHNDACRHQAIIDVSNYPDDVEVPWFAGRIRCGKCGHRGRWVDVRPNWKEAAGNARRLERVTGDVMARLLSRSKQRKSPVSERRPASRLFHNAMASVTLFPLWLSPHLPTRGAVHRSWSLGRLQGGEQTLHTRNLNPRSSIESHMKVADEIKVFQEHSGVAKWHNEWRVEYADTGGGSYVTIFAGSQAEQRARDYHNALTMGALDAIPGAKR